MKLKSKNVLITGGGRGIGEAFARAFAKEGANVSLFARTLAEIEKVESSLKSLGTRALSFPGDVTRTNDVKNWVDQTLKEFGSVDVLINNAGIYGPIGLLTENDLDHWIQAVQINLIGTVLCMKTVLPIMIRQKGGVIINLSGGGALTPFPRFSAYGASKAAVVRLTETAAEEMKEHSIRINAIAPGAVNTRLLDEALRAGELCGKDFLEKCKKQKVGGGTPPEKAAELAVFLAGDESKGITGKVISAVWDDWRQFSARSSELAGSALFTMRRIDEQNFKPAK